MLRRSVAERTVETFDTVFSETNAASTASPSATADTRASSRAVSSIVSTLLDTLSSTERMIRSKRRIASSSASRRFLTLSACATSERSRSRSCSERCSTITARAMSPTSSTRPTPVTSDFQSPRATPRTACVICTRGRLMRCPTSSMIPANSSTDVTAATISQTRANGLRPRRYGSIHCAAHGVRSSVPARRRASARTDFRNATSTGRQRFAASTKSTVSVTLAAAAPMPDTEIELLPARISTPAPSRRENSSSTASRGRKVR